MVSSLDMGRGATSEHLLYSGAGYGTDSAKPGTTADAPPDASKQSLLDSEKVVAIKVKALRSDELLKKRIRNLRLISRILAFCISIAVFIPIAMTLQKYLSTRNTFIPVTNANGDIVVRTAWAQNSKAWPTYLYFSVAAVAVVLNLAIVVAYLVKGVHRANQTAVVATSFTTVVLVADIIVWIVAASIYRAEKNKDGRSNDLWGWTCSPAAKNIQREFIGVVDFHRYCKIQSISWYIGLVQIASAVLIIVIWTLMILRRRTKKKIQKQMSISTTST